MKKHISKQLFVLVAGLGIFVGSFYGCGRTGAKAVSKQACLDSIKAVEAKLQNEKTPDITLYNHAIDAYMHYAGNFPDDTMAPACYFDAANIAMSLSQYQRALHLYDTVCIKYPNFRKVPDCIFIEGYIYDDKLKDTAKARALYMEVINKYPNDTVLVRNSRAAISILGKSYDEIIKQFEEKNKEQKKS